MKTKKALSLILAILMIFSLAVPSLAAAEQDCPIIYIPGIASSKIYADRDDPESVVTVPDNQQLIDFVTKDLLPAAITYAADKDEEKLAKAICTPVNEMLSGWFNNPDGSSVGNSGAVQRIPEVIGKSSTVVFDYDWRGDPLTVADELDAFIDAVCEKSGCEKVAVAAHSLGSIVLVSYLSKYGNDKIRSTVLDSSVVYGVSYVGEFLSGRMSIDTSAFMNYLRSTLTSSEYNELVGSCLDIAEIAGMTDAIIGMLDEAFDAISPVLIKDTLVPVFGSWLTIWAMVPDDKLAHAMDYVFNVNYKGEDMSGLRGKIEAYNAIVRQSKTETLLGLDEAVNLAVISRYGYCSLPLTDEWRILGDTVVDTAYTSLGAVTAEYNDYFSDEYLQGKNPEYISPDRTVDASGCLFSEKTWFIKNLTHSETGVLKGIYPYFLFAEKELTCDTSELERFSYYDRDNNLIKEDTTAPSKPEKVSTLAKFFNFLRIVLTKIAEFFRNMFSK